ncbi:hypothetical protein Cst_c27150 [Thermoclostridium stercorarium subsp. stercorarium DSM 8532]|uniref:Uncharacterized protein n=1 Tax=Thermoclostridium stercorarium (strain ATCC 35414 / DSM 8532 / NCIMB 11754) TaxID=1121335 RepID=L7VN73_THES1|nr:hypothetical protein Cst_c27150 [Thermoclostridium stercorarium subsp. stercorarium DSM 8532]
MKQTLETLLFQGFQRINLFHVVNLSTFLWIFLRFVHRMSV